MSTEIWNNPNDPKPIKTNYKIGYEGLEHSRTGILGFIADIFRATYPLVPIASALAVSVLDWNGDAAVPTYGFWSGPGWSGGSRSSKIEWKTPPCYNINIKAIETNPNLNTDNCYSLVDVICKAHDWRYDQAEKQYGKDTANCIAAMKNADILLLQDIAVACNTHRYNESVGSWDLKTYTNPSFDIKETGYLAKLVPLFLGKIMFLDNSTAADRSLAYTAVKSICSVIPIDGTAFQDPSDPSKKTIFHLKNGIMITQKESATSSEAWITNLNSTKDPVHVKITYDANGSKAADIFVIIDDGTIRINCGTESEITFDGAKNNGSAGYTFEVVGGEGHNTYNLDSSFKYDLIDSGDNDINITSENDGGKSVDNVNNLYREGEGAWESADGSIVLNDQMIILSNGNTIDLGDNFQTGDFGINLLPVLENPVTTNTIIGEDTGNYIMALTDTAQNDRIEGRGGDDWIGNGGGSGGNDWLRGNDGNDLIQANTTGHNIAEGNAVGERGQVFAWLMFEHVDIMMCNDELRIGIN